MSKEKSMSSLFFDDTVLCPNSRLYLYYKYRSQYIFGRMWTHLGPKSCSRLPKYNFSATYTKLHDVIILNMPTAKNVSKPH